MGKVGVETRQERLCVDSDISGLNETHVAQNPEWEVFCPVQQDSKMLRGWGNSIVTGTDGILGST